MSHTMETTVRTAVLPEGIHFEDSRTRQHFYFAMSTMLDAGIPMTDALELLEQSTEDKSYKTFCHMALEKIEAGKIFAGTIKDFPNCFSRSDYRTIGAGERSGALAETLARLGETEEVRLQTRSRLRTAMIYPGFVVLIGSILLLAPAFIFGDISKVYADLGVKVPALLEQMLGLSRLFGTPWFWGLLLLGFGFFYSELQEERANARFRRFARRAWAKLPGFSRLYLIASNAQFCRSLSTQLGAGIPLDKAAEGALLAAGDSFFEEEARVIPAIHSGMDLTEALRESPVIFPIVTAFVECGESTGKLPESLEKAAEYLDVLFEQRLRVILDLIEPAILLLTGIMVGLLAVSTLLPLVQIVDTL